MNVLKFGGSSVKDADRIGQVMEIVTKKLASEKHLVVVVSAMGGITDLLIQMSERAARGEQDYIGYYHQFTDRHTLCARALLGAEKFNEVQPLLDENHETLRDLLKGIFLVREVSPRTMDYVLSFGERNSAFLIAEAFKLKNINTEYLDARRVITTNKDFNSAKVNFKKTNEKIRSYVDVANAQVYMTTGFIASDKGGLTTTLGRGGSDYTAAIFAAALEAEQLEIWTDVDGVLTSDPRKVPKAFTVKQLSYSEAMEMSHFGAKVIYPPTIQPALKANIPIYIKNTFNPDFEGTRIHQDFDPNFRSAIKGISALGNVALVNLQGAGMMGVPGISARLFSALAKEKINLILITQASSEHSISFAVDAKYAKLAEEAISEEFERELGNKNLEPLQVETDKSIVAVIGEKMKSVPGIAGALFSSLGRNGINISAIAQGSSELNISFVIDKQDEAKALNLIHDSFFLSETKSLNVFSIGVGLIGSTLLQQIHSQKEYLRDDLSLQLNIIGLSNSRKMLFDSEAIDLKNWKEQLNESDEKADPERFIAKMKDLNLPNSIFLDNTASGAIAIYYEQILDANISVVTPNKVATSSSYASYLRLKQKAKEKSIKFLYETNVGAGLPVINTLQSLINSGDKIKKIEAVLSGSLSFIFNSFDGSVPFSKLVQKAKALGYTEPDPREDLGGQDVKRKIIILSREAGIAMEPEDVQIDQVLPAEVMAAKDVEAFFEKLESHDETMAERVAAANAEGKKLRLIASSENGLAKLGVQSVDETNPFYGLEGSENMIVFTTERYNERPLIIRGPGAGAEVTAAGVFADIISIGK